MSEPNGKTEILLGLLEDMEKILSIGGQGYIAKAERDECFSELRRRVKGPEVSREWVEQLVNLILNTGEEYVVDFAIKELRERGVTVKEVADEEEPKQYRCEGCGRSFETKIFSHSRAEMGKDGEPIEVECGPITEEG